MIEFIYNVVGILAGLAGLGWFLWWRWRRSQADAGSWIARGIATAVIFVIIVVGIIPLASGFGAFVAVPALAGCMVVLAIMWRHEIIGIVADPIGDVIDGGTEQVEPKPYYAKAEAKRMAGDIPGAVAEVRGELEKFPNDYDGRMRLASLLAEDSEDLPGAIAVIEDTLRLKTLTGGQIAYALNTAADWHIKFGRDLTSARAAIERITTLLAGTDAARHAEQRLANFATPEMLEREDNRQPIAIPEFGRKLGLNRKKHAAPEKPDINAEERRLRDRLVRHPNDFGAREELARLYVEQFEFFERGIQELEVLIISSGAPQREVVEWLHLQADWQVKYLSDVEAGRATLRRIQTLYPKSAVAERAAVAMLHLQATAKGKKKPRPESEDEAKRETAAE